MFLPIPAMEDDVHADPMILILLTLKSGLFLLVGALTLLSVPRARATSEPLDRADIEEKDQWDTTTIFADDAAWEAEFTALEADLPKIEAYRGRLAESPETLLEAIQTWENFIGRAEHLYLYAHLRNDQDTRVNLYQGMLSRIFSLWTRFGQQSAYMRPELLAIEEARMNELMADPKLEVYGFHLERIVRMRPYTLDAGREELLAGSGEIANGPGEIFDIFTNADLKFPSITDDEGNEVVVNNSTWYQLRANPNREVRKAALDAFYGTYHEYRNTLAMMYSSNVKGDLFYFRARGYDSSIHASLYPNDIPVEVYDNLIDAANDNLDPMHRYFALKKKVLGVEEFRSHDVYARMVGEVDLDYDYDTAVEMVLDAVAPLGDQYVADLRAGFENRWVDVYMTEGKKSGAYCSTVYDMHPYVLMNYRGELEDVSTLAHEMGHAMHGYYSNEQQPFIYHDHAIFVAEVASTTNELLMIQKMIDETKDPQVKLYLLDFWANQILNTVFRQTYFAEFEKAAHEAAENGEALTADSMTKMYHDIFQKYHGPALVLDGHLDQCWARIPHFYRSFYVYQYATSYAASVSLVKGLTSGPKKERKKKQEAYLGFLAAGESDYPIEVLKAAGVDMTSPDPIRDLLEQFDEIVTQMEKLVD
jgi:oligoendopeptidase F